MMDVTQEPARKPKSGFAREKVKRLAAEARANKAETKLRELGVLSDVEQIETQEPEQEQLASRDKPRSGYARLRNRHRDLIDLYENLRRDHEELQAAFNELLKLHDGLLADLRAKKLHPLPSFLLGRAQIGGGNV